MRLIDIEAEVCADCICRDKCDRQAYCWAKEMQSVDAVPVVRCKDCKHARKSEDAFDWDGVTPLCECNYSRQPNRWHEYCSYGERKAGDGDD